MSSITDQLQGRLVTIAWANEAEALELGWGDTFLLEKLDLLGTDLWAQAREQDADGELLTPVWFRLSEVRFLQSAE